MRVGAALGFELRPAGHDRPRVLRRTGPQMQLRAAMNRFDAMSASAHRVMVSELPHAGVPILSIDHSLGTKFLPFVLSMTAGSTDVIGFLGLGGLFTAHITGNLVVLAAKVVAGETAPVSFLISVPVFIAVLALSKLIAAGLERMLIASLVPLLLLQFLLLSIFSVICLRARPGIDPNTAMMVVAGMLAVSAMAVQNALARTSLKGAPSTAVMTTNITLFTLDVGEILLGRNAGSVAAARDRAGHTWPAIAGFVLGCVFGALCQAAFGLRSSVLPTGLALVAFALGAAAMIQHAEPNNASYRRDQTEGHQG
jgi:uncharacterized membrane protein YoaK (UPF0700 family)